MGGTDDQLSPRSLFPNGGPEKSRMGKKERRGVFIEKEGGHVRGNGPMRERSHDALGGDGVGGPPPQERRDEYKRLEDMEREAMEAVRRCLRQ